MHAIIVYDKKYSKMIFEASNSVEYDYLEYLAKNKDKIKIDFINGNQLVLAVKKDLKPKKVK